MYRKIRIDNIADNLQLSFITSMTTEYQQGIKNSEKEKKKYTVHLFNNKVKKN